MEFNCLPAAIGSFPYINAELACDKILKYFFQIPLWPQLPKRDFKEQMYLQFFEDIPGLKVDKKNNKIYFEIKDNFEEEMASFYEKIFKNGDLAISIDYAAGFYEFLKREDFILKSQPFCLKGHITGPISFALYITDQNRMPILYNEQVLELITFTIIAKAKWQAEKLKRLSSNIIIFIDEPYLSSFGSALVDLKEETIAKNINLIADELHKINVLVGLHCCGNTDWKLVMNLNIDIISFDAFSYADKFLIYYDSLKNFLQKGGIIAWGIIPTTLFQESQEQNFLKKIEGYLSYLEEKGYNKKDIIKKSLITPSCGLGTLNEKIAEEIMTSTLKLSKDLREKYL